MSIEFVFCGLVACLFFFYGVVQILTLIGLRLLRSGERTLSVGHPHFSVIVAARNEEANIGRCLQSLVNQDYNRAHFEIIVVDDRSNDATGAIVKNYRSRYPNIELIELTSIASDLPAKKNALNEAIRRSQFAILAFTDADCSASPGWLASLAKEYSPEVGVVAGYSPIEQQFPRSFLARWGDFFLRYLEIKNSLGAAAAVGLGNAYLCTGRNFSYRKCVFEEVGGFEKIKHSVSGDDDLFIQLVQRETRWKIAYMTSPESFVETKPPFSLRDFLNQRKRHFSAGKYYALRMKLILALIHSFNALALLTLLLYPMFGAVVLALKIAADAIVFYQGAVLFGNPTLVRSIFPLELAAVVYNLVIGPIGYVGTFSWKGRRS